MSNGLHVPGRVNIAVNRMDAPMAEQFVMPMQTSNGVDLHIVGGLSKLESAAIAIAGASFKPTLCLAPRVDDPNRTDEQHQVLLSMFGDDVAEVAHHVLEACRRREEKPPG